MSTKKKQRERFHFAIDEDLGKSFYTVLSRSDLFDADLFSDHWPVGTADSEWISVAAAKNLIVVSHDGRMRAQHRTRVLESGLRVIIIAGVTKPSDLAKHFVNSWSTIERHLVKRGAGGYFSRFRAPFPHEIAKKLNPKGHIVTWDKKLG